MILSRQPGHSPLPSCHCAARAFSFTSFTSFASSTSSKSFTIRTSKTPFPQLLYNPHLRAHLGSAGNKGLITPLESALTKNSPVSRLESALTKKVGVGVVPASPELATRHSSLRTMFKSFLFRLFHTLLRFLAPPKNSTLLFSCNSELFAQNTRGGGTPLALFTGNGEASVAVVEGHTSNRDHRHTARESLGSAILSTPEEPPCWNPPKVSY